MPPATFPLMETIFEYIVIVFEAVLSVVFFLQAVIVVASCIFVFFSYRNITKDDTAEKFRHILSVATSHAILTCLSVSGYFYGRYNFYSWRGCLVFLAFILTDYGLMQLALPRIIKSRGKK